jgi:hypothetical protein
LTSNLFSISNRQHNLFCFNFWKIFKLVWWFLWIKYNYEKNLCRTLLKNARQSFMFAVCFVEVHDKVWCLPCILCRRTTNFKKNEFLASFYLCITNTLLCNIYFNLVLVSIFLLFQFIYFNLDDFLIFLYLTNLYYF